VRLGKAIVAVGGAAVLLVALVGTASAGRLSTSSLSVKATWARLSYSGGFGTLECEVVVEGSFHARTIAKVAGALSGFITSASITRCARGGATVLRETLPWHVQYASFAGTLPNITSIGARVIGLAFRIREPTFGITCLSRSTTEAPGTITFSREAGGATTTAVAGGTIPCESFSGTLGGTSSSLDNGSGTRVTVTLI
jgi:hypothetical protein